MSGTLLLMLPALDRTGLIPGVPGVHGAVEHLGPGVGAVELYLKSVVWYAAAELLLLDTLEFFLIKAG